MHIEIDKYSHIKSPIHSMDARAKIIVFMIFILIATSVLLITFGQYVLNQLVDANILEMDIRYYLVLTAKWLIVIALFFFSISFLYYFAPAKKDQWKFISAGSTLATILALLSSLGFSYFVNNFGAYNKLYGSIGTIMVVLLWLYFNSFALILGFELNASINNAQLESNNE